jgi:hypothetical protein
MLSVAVRRIHHAARSVSGVSLRFLGFVYTLHKVGGDVMERNPYSVKHESPGFNHHREGVVF